MALYQAVNCGVGFFSDRLSIFKTRATLVVRQDEKNATSCCWPLSLNSTDRIWIVIFQSNFLGYTAGLIGLLP